MTGWPHFLLKLMRIELLFGVVWVRVVDKRGVSVAPVNAGCDWATVGVHLHVAVN